MKKYNALIFLFIIVITITTDLSAQKLLMKKANKLYSMKAYAEAIPYYDHALKKNNTIQEAIIKIADCYRLTNNSKKAMYYYGKVVDLPGADPINVYYYAEALMENGAYDEAKKYMSQYKNDDRGRTFEAAIMKLSTFYKDTTFCHIQPAPFNSPENDFCPVLFHQKKVVFVSARDRTQVISYGHSWTERKYYALYITEQNRKGKYKRPKLFARNIQVRFNDGPISLDKEGHNIFVTRNVVEGKKAVKSVTGIVKLNIYQADYNEAKRRFVNIRDFDYNDKDYNIAHPAVSPDGSRLYFASDMPGGRGGMDLWMCNKLGNGWTKPVNLGPMINTPGDELFPYVYDKNTLYFSSTGWAGIGGLDLFVVKLTEDGMPADTAVNMGAPFNSPADDFGIVFYPGGRKGFFSSNRAGNDMNDDIYSFTIKRTEKLPYTFLVEDSVTKEPLESNLVLKDYVTGDSVRLKEKNGKYTVMLMPGHNYIYAATAEFYKPKLGISFLAPKDTASPLEIPLASNKYFITGTVYELFKDSTSRPLEGASVTIIAEPNITIGNPDTTNAKGRYVSGDLKPNTVYGVLAQKNGYFAGAAVVGAILPGGSTRDIYLRKNDFVVGKAIVIENIYFDFNKWNIRPDAAFELEKIVSLMKENPEIIIELSSHTDCRGTYAYNMALSDKRAKSSAAYIVSRGIDSKRITGKGYGESKLVNDCKCEGKVVSSCTEEEHQMNRRTEFKVTGFVKGIGNVNFNTGK